MSESETAPDQPAYSDAELLLADELVREHHHELAQIARDRRRDARFTDTMMTYDVLHEAYLKLQRSDGFRSVRQFLGVASLAMRHVIIDHARRKIAARKAGSEPAAVAEDIIALAGGNAEDVVALGDLLDSLGRANPRWLRVFDARFFGGLTEVEAATLLNVSERTVRRDWNDARAWLSAKLRSA